MSGRIPTLQQQPVIDHSTGNIAIQGRSAVTIGYQLRDEAAGAMIDLRGAALAFEIAGHAQGGGAITGVQGEDVFTQTFTLGQALVGALPLATGLAFAVIDSTTFGQPAVLWSGWLTVYGFQGS